MLFEAYSDRYYFDFRHGIRNHTASGAARESVRHRDLSTGQVFEVEYPKFEIKFASFDSGKGSWNAKDCEGIIQLTKVRG